MSTPRPLAGAVALGTLLIVAACSESPTGSMSDPQLSIAESPSKSPSGTMTGPQVSIAESPQVAHITGLMTSLNTALAEAGVEYRAAMTEFITHVDAQAVGLTVLAKDVGNRRAPFDFVPHDPRREWSGPPGGETDDITYAIDRTGDAVPPFGGLDAAATEAAIVRAMEQWDALTCSALAITRNDDFGSDVGVAAFEVGLGGSPFVFADIQHAGWRDVDFEAGVLAATVTYAFVDEAGLLTDINRDRYFDVAFREIYYDPSFAWADDGIANVDVETIALHESGHGLSAGHFGMIAFLPDGSLLRAPIAVMNALYAAPSRSLLGTDIGGHCNHWAAWHASLR